MLERVSGTVSSMNKLLWLFAIVLIFLGPIIGVYVGIQPAIFPFLGIVCGVAAIVRGTRPLPEGDGAPSTGAEADAKILCNTTVDYSPKSGIGITDVGGA
jgi:hypothetical protein